MADLPKGIAALSERQKEILRLVYRGHLAKEIAGTLGISEHTVKTHINEARRRLDGVSSREAARLLHDLESRPGLAPEEGRQKEVMPKSADHLPASDHGQEISPERTIPSDQLARTGNGLADARSTRQAYPDRGNDRHSPTVESDGGTGESDLLVSRRLRMVIGRWGLFARRIKRVKLWQWFGLTLLLAVLLPLVVAVLFEASLSMIRVVQKM